MKRGHIRQRGARSWELKFDVASTGGKRTTRSITIKADNRKEAERELTRLLGLADKGELPDASKANVAEYLDAYLAFSMSAARRPSAIASLLRTRSRRFSAAPSSRP